MQQGWIRSAIMHARGLRTNRTEKLRPLFGLKPSHTNKTYPATCLQPSWEPEAERHQKRSGGLAGYRAHGLMALHPGARTTTWDRPPLGLARAWAGREASPNKSSSSSA